MKWQRYFGTVAERQRDLPEGAFGAVAPYLCECGPVWKSPDYDDGHCRLCGSYEISPNDIPPSPVFKARRVTRMRSAA